MMFSLPRRKSLSNILVVITLGFFGLWLYSSSSDIPQSDVVLDFSRDLQANGNLTTPTRSHTFENPEEAKQHANQTLQKMVSNMTLMKVNKTILQNILHKVNNSKLPDSSQRVERIEDVIDQTNVENPHPFKYILNSQNVCKNKDIFVIAYIHTAPKHYKRRMVIRQTWGNPKYYKDLTMRVVFVMGKTFDEPSVQQALAFEAEEYGDIVQEDFLDSYKNLTYKGIASLKWISMNCRHAKFVLKADDDIFVNTFTLFRHLKSLDANGINNKGLILCLVWNRMKVMRSGKWKVDKEEFNDDYYPTYCSGSAFTISTDVAIKLHQVSYHVPFFWVDDFYITGLLPLKAGFSHKQFMSTYVLDGRKLEEKFTGPQWFTYIFSHVHNLDSIQSVWNKLVDLANGKTIPKVTYALPGEVKSFEEAWVKSEKEKEAAKKAKAEAKKA